MNAVTFLLTICWTLRLFCGHKSFVFSLRKCLWFHFSTLASQRSPDFFFVFFTIYFIYPVPSPPVFLLIPHFSQKMVFVCLAFVFRRGLLEALIWFRWMPELSISYVDFSIIYIYIVCNWLRHGVRMITYDNRFVVRSMYMLLVSKNRLALNLCVYL